MKYHPFAFWLFFFCLGILAGNFLEIPINWCIVGGAFSLSLLFFFRKQSRYFAYFTFLFCLFLGIYRIQKVNYKPPQNVNNYLKTTLQIKIIESLKPSKKYYKYKAQILPSQSDSLHLAQQSILLYTPKPQGEKFEHQTLWLHGTLSNISPPKNPHTFDYKQYMHRQGVELQLFCDTILLTNNPKKFDLKYQLSLFKSNFKEKLKQLEFSPISRIFIQSLVLGDRNDFDADFRQKLSAAGISHLFAISGLHVGIIYGFLFIIFYPVLFLPYGRNLRIILSITSIWIYTYFVGATPSVVRAAFMLTMFSLSFIFQRRGNFYHILAFTALILLFINPNYLFDVGFQLSYCAVFFIVWATKFFKPLRPEKGKFKIALFDLILVTLAAQLGVLPLSIAYFHQFSWLFLIGNLLFFPTSAILVGFCFSLFFIVSLGITPSFLVKFSNLIFGSFDSILNLSVENEAFLIQNIHWNLGQILTWWGIIFAFAYAIKNRKITHWNILLTLIIIFLSFGYFDVFQAQNKKQFIIFHQQQGNLIAYRAGQNLWVFGADSLSSIYTIQPFATQEEIRKIEHHPFDKDLTINDFKKSHRFIQWGENIILINPQNPKIPTQADFLYFTQGSPELDAKNLNQLFIFDGASKSWQVQKFEAKNKHFTADDGFFMLEE
ncbi:ComEC family competence protein [Ornithobacterium rhinotracheale]|uniref:ComEC family competence protein n=1 Tax=Ornithobacterium rhinotracheale TaxID=28251 RepID=A0A3R5YX22_ORNRH|nr:ComEC/Rec2 family competence protein [Ornithobacterium rhinotracheale]QAR31545.1 ComEC family competence protein [Ornithobacterium rhinotracheale]